MTIGVGLQVHEGLVALADIHTVQHEQVSSATLTIHEHEGRSFFVMTAGLRSIRDKVTVRMDDHLAGLETPIHRMHELVTWYGNQVKAVRAEDGPTMKESGLRFDLHSIIGGQLGHDDTPTLFLVYPEGHWTMASEDSPSFIIGHTAYGKPILDRLLSADTPLPHALSLAYLAFDATRASVTDVEFPIDTVAITDHGLRQQRFQLDDLAEVHESWHLQLRIALAELPTAWATPLWQPPTASVTTSVL